MSTIAGTTTAAELMQLSDFPPHALLEGELVLMSPAGGEHGFVAGNVLGLVWSHVRKARLGQVFTAETGYLLQRQPDTVLAPDVSFVAADRVAVGKDRRGYMPLAPDLAVEVVSPSDRRGEVERKVATWLDAGTKLIWVVWIDKDLVTVHRPGEGVRELSLDDAIDGGEVLPGFSQQVRAFFE